MRRYSFGHTISSARNSIEIFYERKYVHKHTQWERENGEETIASNNYCLWKLRTFGEFFHHSANIKRTIQTCLHIFAPKRFRMANTTIVGSLYAIIFIHNGHWNFIAFLIYSACNKYNNFIVLIVQQYWKMAPIFSASQKWAISRNGGNFLNKIKLACKLKITDKFIWEVLFNSSV